MILKCDTLTRMGSDDDHRVGLRELRHRTGDVLARVRRGETLDVTDRGELIARITPIPARETAPVLDQLIEAGRVRRAERPGFRPRMAAGDGTDRLADALSELRDDPR